MKKLLPLFLVLVFAVVLAACGDDEGQTTINITQPTATTTAPQDMSAGSETDPNGVLLTTQFGETVPTVYTTAFDISYEATNTSFTVPGDDLSVPNVTPPVVVTDYVPTTQAPPTSLFPDLTDDTSDTEDDGGTEPSATKTPGGTDESESTDSVSLTEETSYNSGESPSNKPLYSIGSSNDERGNITIIFDYADWSRIKSQKANVKVSCNGKTKTCKGTVNGVDDNGAFEYVVDISSMNPSDGDYITITFPKGAIKTINGQQSSAAFTVSLTYTV